MDHFLFNFRSISQVFPAVTNDFLFHSLSSSLFPKSLLWATLYLTRMNLINCRPIKTWKVRRGYERDFFDEGEGAMGLGPSTECRLKASPKTRLLHPQIKESETKLLEIRKLYRIFIGRKERHSSDKKYVQLSHFQELCLAPIKNE